MTHKIPEGNTALNEPEQDNDARHAQDQYPCPGNYIQNHGKSTNEVVTYRISRLAHHKVNRKNTARTRQATLLAFVSKPHAIRQAPMKLDPRYPAGSVSQGIPPDMRVAPPSSAEGQCQQA